MKLVRYIVPVSLFDLMSNVSSDPQVSTMFG
jgi:hypothetical protein